MDCWGPASLFLCLGTQEPPPKGPMLALFSSIRWRGSGAADGVKERETRLW